MHTKLHFISHFTKYENRASILCQVRYEMTFHPKTCLPTIWDNLIEILILFYFKTRQVKTTGTPKTFRTTNSQIWGSYAIKT